MMKKPVKVFSPILKYERVLYSILNIRLPTPVPFKQVGFWIGSLIFMFIFLRLPGLGFLQAWPLLNYGFIPIALSVFFTKFKLDGKSPHIFLLDFLLYQLSPKTYNKYEKADTPAIYQYKTPVTYRKGDVSE